MMKTCFAAMVAACALLTGCGGGTPGPGNDPGAIFPVAGLGDADLAGVRSLIDGIQTATGPGAQIAQQAFTAKYQAYHDDQEEFDYLLKILEAANQAADARGRADFKWSFTFDGISYTIEASENPPGTFTFELSGEGSNARFEYEDELVATGIVDETTIFGTIICDRLRASWFEPNSTEPAWSGTLLVCDDMTREGWVVSDSLGPDTFSYFLADETGTSYFLGFGTDIATAQPILEGDFSPGADQGAGFGTCPADGSFVGDMQWFAGGTTGDGSIVGGEACYGTIPDPGDFAW